MVKEVAVLGIGDNDAAEFERVYKEVAPIIRKQPGYHHDELLHVVEDPTEYVLIIHWDNVEAHQRFVDSPDFPPLAEKWGVMQKEVTVRHCKLVEAGNPA